MNTAVEATTVLDSEGNEIKASKEGLMDKVSNFYSAHKGLFKMAGGALLVSMAFACPVIPGLTGFVEFLYVTSVFMTLFAGMALGYVGAIQAIEESLN